MKRIVLIFVMLAMAASMGCSSKWIGKNVTCWQGPIYEKDYPYDLVNYNKYGVFRYTISKNGNHYAIDGVFDWTWDKECRGVCNTKMVFLLVKDGVVVEALPSTISGRSTDRLTYHREFVTDVDFDGVVVGEWYFQYRIG